jgi:hypothetical protein
MTNLFGGAIKSIVPSDFVDISVIREVPDHQEVFVDNNSNSSIIIEVLSRPDDVPDNAASRFYFDDLCQLNQVIKI